MVFDELVFFNWFMIFMIATGVIVFITLFYVTAGYGRFISEKHGLAINRLNKLKKKLKLKRRKSLRKSRRQKSKRFIKEYKNSFSIKLKTINSR